MSHVTTWDVLKSFGFEEVRKYSLILLVVSVSGSIFFSFQ